MKICILNYRIENVGDEFLIYPPKASDRSGGNKIGFFSSLSRAISWIILNDLDQNVQSHYEQLLLVEEAVDAVHESPHSDMEGLPC